MNKQFKMSDSLFLFDNLTIEEKNLRKKFKFPIRMIKFQSEILHF